MDAWNALWFWPLAPTLTLGVQPPSIDQWIAGVSAVLGKHFEMNTARAVHGGQTLGLTSTWAALGDSEQADLAFAGVAPIHRALIDHPWLGVAERISSQQGFFHWELDFVTVFARGGFDLQVGNPPWVRPTFDLNAMLAEGDPWWQIANKPSQSTISQRRSDTLARNGIRGLVLDGESEALAMSSFLSSDVFFPHLSGLQPDLYRCFMEVVWRHSSTRGKAALIHLDTHFTEERAGRLRAATYPRLRRHWDFINELSLFEIQHQKRYGVNVYGAPLDEVRFMTASSLYHPGTVIASLKHDGSGVEPGFKDENDNWDLRPHQSRITYVDSETLGAWHSSLENEGTPTLETRMVYAVNRSAASVFQKLGLLRVSVTPRFRPLLRPVWS